MSQSPPFADLIVQRLHKSFPTTDAAEGLSDVTTNDAGPPPLVNGGNGAASASGSSPSAMVGAGTQRTTTGELSILRGVDLELSRGAAAAITGPSGSGKSTLLYILGLLEQPTSGHITIFGEQPHQWTPARQAKFRNERIGFVFQDHHLLPQLSVLENVVLPAMPGAGVTAQVEQRSRQLLDRVGLGHRLSHRPAQLSGGERQRVAVCRALINQPSLLLADEPTGNLDRATALVVGHLLLELAREHQAILLTVTHSSELAKMFGTRFELRDGQLVTSMATA